LKEKAERSAHVKYVEGLTGGQTAAIESLPAPPGDGGA
jgi:hypothetical protein